MRESQFKSFVAAAQAIGGEYSDGYRRGVRRHYHGDQFGSSAEHEQWMQLSDHRQELGDGYRDGFAGLPPRGFHGNLGNLNAQGELPADSSIQFRVNSQVKASYVKQAQREGLKLSAWIIKTLDAEANKESVQRETKPIGSTSLRAWPNWGREHDIGEECLVTSPPPPINPDYFYKKTDKPEP